MQVIASYLMCLPRLYITCLRLLSKLSGRERGRTYCINILLKKEYTNKKKLYGHNNNNYLDEDMPIMCFDPRKITFFGYDILQVCTNSSVKI